MVCRWGHFQVFVFLLLETGAEGQAGEGGGGGGCPVCPLQRHQQTPPPAARHTECSQSHRPQSGGKSHPHTPLSLPPWPFFKCKLCQSYEPIVSNFGMQLQPHLAFIYELVNES